MAAALVQRLISDQGGVEVIGNKLCAAGEPLDHSPIVDQVEKEHGFGCTIFHRDVRIATTAVTPGSNSRAVGTRPEEQPIQQVYRLGQRYAGITRTLGDEWVIVYIPLRDLHQRIVGMIAAYRRVSHYLSNMTTLDGAPEALILHDARGKVLDANRAAADMLALSRAELETRHLEDFTAISRDALHSIFANLGPEPSRVETFWRRSDRYSFPVELSIGPMNVEGQPRMLTIGRDFSRPHAARQQLQRLSAKLTQSEKMAALGKLVAGVTHDLNTPLGAISSAQQTTAAAAAKLRGALSESHPAALEMRGVRRPLDVVVKSVQTIADGAERIKDVLARLAGFARLDRARVEKIELSRCVADVFALLEHRLPDGVRLEHRVEDSPTLRCYAADINQLLMSLVTNGIEAVGEQGVVMVEAVREGEELALVVADGGVGIPEADQRRIFDPGFTTKGVGYGGGLGLSIAHQIVERHGGHIDVQSVPGQGTRLTVRLKLAGPTGC